MTLPRPAPYPLRRPHRYDASKSSTYVPRGEYLELKYGKGSATGVLTEDTVILGGKLEHAVFGEMTHIADMEVCIFSAPPIYKSAAT